MSKTKPRTLDLSQYRTPELLQSIVELVSVPGAMLGVFYCSFFGAFLGFIILELPLILGSTVFVSEGLSRYVAISGVGLLALLAGALIGFVYGIVRLISKSFDSMLQIVEILLQLTGQIARDSKSISSGEADLPSPAKLMAAVYEQVLVPTIGKAILKAFGFPGLPVLWIYQLSLGQLVAYVIGRLTPESFDKVPDKVELDAKALETKAQIEASMEKVIADYGIEQQATKAREQLVAGMEKVNKYESRITNTLDWTRNKIIGIGSLFKRIVLTPCYLLLIVVSVVVLAVYGVVVFLLTKIWTGASELMGSLDMLQQLW